MHSLRYRKFRSFHKQLQLKMQMSNLSGNKHTRIISYQNSELPKTVKKLLPWKTVVEEKQLRVNAVNMQMLSKNLYKQLFKTNRSSGYEQTSDAVIRNCLNDLHKHGMHKNNVEYMPDVVLDLPKLEGADLEEHFQRIGEQQSAPYRNLVLALLDFVPVDVPKHWVLRPGWTRYAPNAEPESVLYPLEDAYVLDVEVAVRYGPAPTLATALSREAWYGWVSPVLCDASIKLPLRTQQQHFTLSDLIPMESDETATGFQLGLDLKRPKVVVGHNVSYDRARIKEQYWLERTGMRFVDTMSLHVCVSGITSYQRAVLKTKSSDADTVENGDDQQWKAYASLNSLSQVYKLYCNADLDKQTRDVFVEGSLSEIKEQFQSVMSYCANDVRATYNVLGKLFPMFLERFPHPVTFAGMLELGMAYLPVNNNWTRYIEDCQQIYEDLNVEAKLILARHADNACQMMHNQQYKEDIWMWDQDWTTQQLTLKKSQSKTTPVNTDVNHTVCNNSHDEEDGEELEESRSLQKKFQSLMDTKHLLPVKRRHLPGYPMWYRKLCSKHTAESSDWVPGPHLISTSMQITPKLLSLTWEGYPLHYIRDKGWGFLVPHSLEMEGKQLPLNKLIEMCPLIRTKLGENQQLLEKNSQFYNDMERDLNRKVYWTKTKKKKASDDELSGLYKGAGIWCNTDLEECCWFLKLPHKNGVSLKVGNPLARDFLNKFADNVLAGASASAERVLSIARMLSYWRNNRDRIEQQMVVWLKEHQIPRECRSENIQLGAIIPQIVVCGTLTRRAMEPTWMTASNAQTERVGSELRAQVQAPNGYAIVGADVDSQELWIASVVGDAASTHMHGATPLGWMTLIGTKANGTDMHSVTAQAIGITRDQAKILNYARIYGAGQTFAESLLRQFNPMMTETDAKRKARKMFALTKGKRVYRMKQEYLSPSTFADKWYGSYEAYELAKVHGKRIEEMFEKPKWVGGTESAMFNRLEEIAQSASPVTPFLHARLTRALEHDDQARFLPTRVNWVVQSGAVDFLHLMLVCMRWLLNDEARFCLSFHDDVRYLTPERVKYKVALAMHITNLLTRAFCSSRLGVNDLPQSVAFFTSVEVDTVIRKESHVDCKTPSNPHGLLKGYGIAHGESLTIQDCIEKTKNDSNCLWNSVSR